MTYEQLLQKMLARVPNSMDKREGSIIYDALAPAAAEMAQMYIELERILGETFADTATRQYLIKRAAERGLVPYPATKAILKGAFNCKVAPGERFTLEGLHYQVIKELADEQQADAFVYQLECEVAGEKGNQYDGKLLPVSYIDGLTSARITDVIIPGEDDEGTEIFRKRYFESLDSQAFGGNIADYKEKTNSLSGIAGVKVYPAWNGGGTVKLVIQDSNFNGPNQSLIDVTQNKMDPPANSGKGLGIAPIGHKVTVEGVGEQAVNISTTIVYQEGWEWADIQAKVEEKIEDYLLELRKTWADEKGLIVRISQIENRLLDVVGVVDIGNTSINGSLENLVVDNNKIPIRGVVNG